MLKKVLRDSIPTIISLTLSGMYSVVDGIFIGQAAGDTGLAAINLAWPITAVITALGIGIGTGGSVLISHYRGQGKQEDSRKAKNNTITLLVLLGIGITLVLLKGYPTLLKGLGAQGGVYEEALRYSEVIVKGSVLQVLGTGVLTILRNMDMAVHAMISMITGLWVNIGVNYYLMFERGLGIRGAALGTVAAQGIVVCVSMILMCRKQRIVPCLNWKLSAETVRTGITAFGMSIAPSVTLVFTNWQCLKYGREEAVACYAVICYITFPVQYMLTGIGDGTQPLMSYYHGAGRKREVAQIKKTAYLLAAGIGAGAAILTIALAPALGGWFGLSSQAAESFETGMKISAVAFFLLGFVKFNTSYLNATMQTKQAIVFTYAESFLAAPILLWVLPIFWKLNGVWYAFPATAAVMLLAFSGSLLYREKGKKNEKKN